MDAKTRAVARDVAPSLVARSRSRAASPFCYEMGMEASDLWAILSGGAVGFSLGLIGGGGSILAVPLLLYVVGVADPHVAIGTSAFAVAVNAFANLLGHWRAGNVEWPSAALFAVTGAVGAALGSSLGKLVDGQKLLVLFALVMIALGVAMLRPREAGGPARVSLDLKVASRLAAIGFATGTLSGFLGIGGGFLIVPGMMLASGMGILHAIGSSLLSVGAFGLTTAVNYSLSGLVDWKIAVEFIFGGALGGVVGMMAAMRLSTRRRALGRVYAGVVFAVAAYMLFRAGARAFSS
jgi:uncharacterized protein